MTGGGTGCALALAGLLVLAATGCQAGVSPGAPCVRASDCSGSLVCRLGRCRAQCVEQRDCPIGAVCLIGPDHGGSCTLTDDPDCRTSGCPSPLACVGATCVNLCTTLVECPPGSALRDRIDGCVRGDAPDAGPPADAGSCRPGACDPIVQIAAADWLSCALTASGRPWCWGAGSAIARDPASPGCVGDVCAVPGPVSIEIAPGSLQDAVGVASIVARRYFGCMTVGAGDAYCWTSTPDDSAVGNDGDGRFARRVIRVGGTDLTAVAQLVPFARTALARTSAGSWVGWGWDDTGQFAGTTTTGQHVRALDVAEPVVGATLVRGGGHHGCALVAGEAWCWGENDLGQAGDLAHVGAGAMVLGPRRVEGVAGATDLSLGRWHSCALLGTGDVTCWGDRFSVGTDAPAGCVPAGTDQACPATRVDRGPTEFRRLASNGDGSWTCAVDASDDVLCWGSDNFAHRQVPERVDLPRPVAAVAVHWSHACALAAGEVFCWGLNDAGQLGRPTSGMADLSPAPVVWP